MTKHAKPIIYLIRHGEKDAKLSTGKDPLGLSAQGLTRAQGIVQVFGTTSPYNIQHIIAEKPNNNGRRARPYETVLPLANILGLKVDHSIDRDDVKAVAKAAEAYNGVGNVLICWEHGTLAKIAKALGVKGYSKKSGWSGHVEYPTQRYDLIWTIEAPYHEIDSVTSEGVVGLDSDISGAPVSQAST
ncbi:hypothetical protein BT63DRAFT_424110 [Microthyrium microscopicum]|uniref:Phosphoglycerate mutase family protein n=1 Tax=Microthyrium microscopicum TaxID=703497 RepID=A0A6A6UEU5_9PEZI|nr:hypothetical protein BT63DRAFT_424110 [Microthyrium microscopicum]